MYPISPQTIKKKKRKKKLLLKTMLEKRIDLSLRKLSRFTVETAALTRDRGGEFDDPQKALGVDPSFEL